VAQSVCVSVCERHLLLCSASLKNNSCHISLTSLMLSRPSSILPSIMKSTWTYLTASIGSIQALLQQLVLFASTKHSTVSSKHPHDDRRDRLHFQNQTRSQRKVQDDRSWYSEAVLRTRNRAGLSMGPAGRWASGPAPCGPGRALRNLGRARPGRTKAGPEA